MIAYSLEQLNNGRLLTVDKLAKNRFRFYTHDGEKRVPIKLQESINGNWIAYVIGKVLVFKKPHFMTFHKECRRLNSKALWIGSGEKWDEIETTWEEIRFKDDRLLEDMLEIVEII